MANNTLQKITARAKQIRKASPKMKWTAAVKKAGAEYRSKGKPGKVVKTVKKTARKKVAAVPVKKMGGKTIAGLKAETKKMLLSKYGLLSAAKVVANTKREKTAIQKEINKIRADIRRYS